MNVKDLMEIQPEQWGLRGDPYLWDEIAQNLADVEVPESQNELERMIKCSFEALTGQSIKNASEVFVERYSHGGMSSGVVDGHFWREIAIPFIVQNSQKRKQDNDPFTTIIDLSRMYQVVNDSIRVKKGSDSIIIEVLSIGWDGPHTPVSEWVLYKELSVDCNLNSEINAVLRSKYFGFCHLCNCYFVTGHMFRKKMCQGCASQYLGVVY